MEPRYRGGTAAVLLPAAIGFRGYGRRRPQDLVRHQRTKPKYKLAGLQGRVAAQWIDRGLDYAGLFTRQLRAVRRLTHFPDGSYSARHLRRAHRDPASAAGR